MKLIYIAGKYSGKNYSEIDDNIKKAEAKAIELIAKKGIDGFYPVTPHLNTAHFEIYEPAFNNIDYKYWIRGSVELLLKCDGVLMLEGWEDSCGAVNEYEIAKQKKIPVYFSVDEIK